MANSEKKSAFEVLNAINVNDHTETKSVGGTNLTYLSWAWAWAEVKKAYPDATYEIEKFNGIPYAYDPLTGYMVYTKVTIEGITHEMWLPVMDANNKAMKAESYQIQTKYKTITVAPATMFDVNKTIMRCLVKNLAMFGLGLYIYAGEDLPDAADVQVSAPAKATKKAPVADQITCQMCGVVIGTHGKATAQQVATATKKQFGKVMCWECGHRMKQEQEAQAQMAQDEELQLPFPIEE